MDTYDSLQRNALAEAIETAATKLIKAFHLVTKPSFTSQIINDIANEYLRDAVKTTSTNQCLREYDIERAKEAIDTFYRQHDHIKRVAPSTVKVKLSDSIQLVNHNAQSYFDLVNKFNLNGHYAFRCLSEHLCQYLTAIDHVYNARLSLVRSENPPSFNHVRDYLEERFRYTPEFFTKGYPCDFYVHDRKSWQHGDKNNRPILTVKKALLSTYNFETLEKAKEFTGNGLEQYIAFDRRTGQCIKE